MGGHVSLSYYPGRGLMEVPRMLLAIAGKFPPVSVPNQYHI
jgi:hypothetical protein